MDLNRLTRDADDLIRKVVSRYNQLYVPAGSISQVELDLMLDDLRKLYDTFKTIGQVNIRLHHDQNNPQITVPTAKPVDPEQNETDIQENRNQFSATPEPFQHEPQPEQKLQPQPEAMPDQEPEVIAPQSSAEVTEQQIISKPEPETLSPYKEPEFIVSEIADKAETGLPAEEESLPGLTPETTTAMLVDKFNSGNKSLSETMAANPSKDGVAGRLLYQPIADLASGIGLNDKFTFISELFANNTVQYEEAITRINKAVNQDEASWILQKYQTSDWDHKQETLLRLKEFIKRRFI